MIHRFDILKNKNYPIGKTWVYKIDFADEYYLGEVEVDTSRTSFYIKNKMLSQDKLGNMFVSIEFSIMEFDSIPEKLVSFLNKILNLSRKYILQLNKEGQIIEIQLPEEKFNDSEINKIYDDEFYKNLNDNEKLAVNKNIEKLDKSGFKKDIKKSLILLFCYPGYFRSGLSNEYSLESHDYIMNSNFLKDLDWNVHFSMFIYNIYDKEINLISTGNVYQGTTAEEDLLFQKIHNHFEAEDTKVYTDYNFEVTCDYTLCSDNYFIKKASINICETLNNEEIEFNKNIEIKLVDNFNS